VVVITVAAVMITMMMAVVEAAAATMTMIGEKAPSISISACSFLHPGP
jgi:hypothetical protein